MGAILAENAHPPGEPGLHMAFIVDCFLSMRKAIFYIDGLNLYHGIIKAKLHDTRWLDVQALCQRLLHPGEEAIAVRYFNAPAWKRSKRDRQTIYLAALENHCDLISVHLGTFMSKGWDCPRCDLHLTQHEEKQTDVALGAFLVNDLYRKPHDISYIVSGDSDILGAIDVARSVRDIEIRVALPPRRGSFDLEKSADEHRLIKAKHLRPNQLPETVIDKDGQPISKPEEWR